MDTSPQNSSDQDTQASSRQFSMDALFIGTLVGAIVSLIATSTGPYGPLLAWLLLTYCVGALARIQVSWRLGFVCIAMLVLLIVFWQPLFELSQKAFP